ncbi:LLM class flavin-dependent oxidoreductase [Kutzneria buriramensis]|uniref:F420-dependent oxidoreductase-like protein n=1 Tax=Kutzneria buriramensis TaxID=1045776 RepID=A0A3E0IC31_9PSEU|nr:LLM class flavin-dependent oxidoreductase [Kutzneria buriramensis]REH55725.1 F420-dependent oxidoreductase-like protein [Kutzneria buriramensis]
MRLGVFLNSVDRTLEDLVEEAAAAEVDAVYVNETVGWDPVTLAALIGARVPGVDIGTAVTVTYPRHPAALAAAALSAQAATGNRFVLGIGPSHRPAVEERYGVSYDRPATHIRDYLTKLRPLLHNPPHIPDVRPPKLLISALGPVMLGIADELADGTILVWTTAKGVTELVAPRLHGKEIVLTAMVGVTDDADALRQQIATETSAVGDLPNYRRHLDRQGLTSVVETAIIGDEKVVAAELRRLEEAGVTELLVSVAGPERERTLAALKG